MVGVSTWPSNYPERAKAVAVAPNGATVLALGVQIMGDRAGVLILQAGKEAKDAIRVIAQTPSSAEQIVILDGSDYLSGIQIGNELQFAGLTVPKRNTDMDYNSFLVKLGFDQKGVWGLDIAGRLGEGHALIIGSGWRTSARGRVPR